VPSLLDAAADEVIGYLAVDRVVIGGSSLTDGITPPRSAEAVRKDGAPANKAQ
jgi:hypothetical protein